MDNIRIQELIKSTKLLSRLYNNDMPLNQKVEIIEQVSVNLKILKSELTEIEYSENFDKLEKSTNEIVDRLTNPSFIQALVEKLGNLLNI